ncbi:hypothetical protein CARUB_v10002959mg [Capsella rubella]|uniref:J domain-containing protein n=1 Tax=Capsella rubella TaxID=81985 RepID=R0HEX9_9BRAS|nr:uncharacterized protein LOC17881197 [Capsella rubella]XP_023637174.1 uncharacterized protein LOC17881197 [Capsella rubella]EOA22343.1 hypothetical protein CARUB_v10002959mg [Capsella rubella]
MECNKEEALRAKELAEDKMKNGDFVGALKLLLKAQCLFPGLESLPQMIAVCDVHKSAETKINGLENWYGILQVMHFADDATIKKQVRKLALLLHPDKNQFPGAEAAFKLVWDASSFLADKDKRSRYDIKRRIYLRFASKDSTANSGVQRPAANSASDSAISNVTFWTRCEHCGYRYKYLRKYVNTVLHCTSCQRTYMAYDTGFNAPPPKPSTGQTEVRNQGPCNTSAEVEKKVQPGSVAAEVEKNESFNENINNKNGGGESKKFEVKESRTEAESMKNYDVSSNEGKMKSAAKLNKPQPKVTEPERGASKSVPDESVSRSDKAPSMSKDKNKRKKCVEDPIEIINVDASDIIKDKADSKDSNKRKSPRRSQQSSHAVEVGSDDFLSPPKKRSKSKSNSGLKSEQTTKKGFGGVGSSKRLDSGGSCAPSCVLGKAKKNVDSGYPEISSTKYKDHDGCEANGERVVMAGKMDSNHNANEMLITEDSPDPEFSNFELTTNCFAVDQVWSIYDSIDGMPRLYARIKKVLDSEFKMWITWIEPLHDVKENSIPIACGIFRDGDTDEENDHLKFSCQMFHLTRNNSTVIYPRKGEIWAVFRRWDISWSATSENHKQPYEYDFVEILSNFKDEIGLGVAYLGKVEGFVSLFHQAAQNGILQIQIPPSEMLRFSHKVPAFKMTGKEREGVPPGCFELDTAALPKQLFEIDYSKADVVLNRERPDGKTIGPFPEASKVKMQANTTPESSPLGKKRPKVHDKHVSFSNESDGRRTNHEMNSVKKTRKSVKAVDGLKLRKSPRLLSQTKNQVTSRSGREIAEKMTTPKKSEKTTTMDSSRTRKSRRDIYKLTGNLKKHGRNDDSLSESRGNGLLTQLNGSAKGPEPVTHVPSKPEEENHFDFESQRSWDKFQIDQVWAVYSNDKGIPRKYAQIKKIDTIPEFKLHVAPLELYRPPTHMPRPVCCGRFKLKTGKAEVLLPSSFSHQVQTVKSKRSRFEVYPGKGEIWALYKNWNTTDNAETEELEIVEVVETDEQRIKVMPLQSKEFNNKPLYERTQQSNATSVDISKTEVCRFSHQIPAFRHERRVSRFGDGAYWELDVKAVRGLNSENA